MTIDARDVTIVFGQYVEIMRLWDAGKIDGAACWAPCLDHVLTKPHGGTGAPGALLYDAETLLRWGFGAVRRADISPMNRGQRRGRDVDTPWKQVATATRTSVTHGSGTGIVIVAHDDFISRRPDVVQRVVERSIRAANDYRTNRDGPDWTAGRFADAAGRFLAMDLGNETTVPAAFVVNQLGRTEWPDTRTQIGFLEIGIESLQHQAAFSFAQKDLAEPPYEDPSIYLPHIGASFLRAVTTETVPLDAEPDPVPDFIPYAARAQLPVPGEGCEPFSVIDGDATFDDGSTGENAYVRRADISPTNRGDTR